MADIFQKHVLHNAKEDLSQSVLFTNEDYLDKKDKELISNISSKSSRDLTAKEQEQLKHIVRKNTPVATRKKIWLLLSGGAEITYHALFEETCEELFTQEDFIPDGEEANSKEYLTYYLTAEGGNMLRRVLCVIKHLNPDITYCPVLEPIISILLHYFDEEETFSIVSGLLSKSFAAPFVDQTKIDNVATDATLQDLFQSVNKKGSNRISSFFQPEESTKNKVVLFPSWIICIFENLDFVSLTRLLDCLFAEGIKMLFRVGLFVLQSFYNYSLTFQQLLCSNPNDLVSTIGQFTESLTISAEDLLKSATKISITNKQVVKMREENKKLYKANKLEWSDTTSTKHVVAVDLRQVSDIIKPNQWQELNEWLPPQVQIQQPFLLFTTNKDGYNLKTLYQLCEEEDQTLMIIQTTTNEIFGAYLSSTLKERHDGRKNVSYFGTGETFLFTLSPVSFSYHWDQNLHRDDGFEKVVVAKPKRKNSHYVFVNTIPLIKDLDTSDSTSTKKKSTSTKEKTRKSSMKRRLSKKLSFTSSASSNRPGFDRSVSRSAYSKRPDNVSVNIQPLSAINLSHSSYSVPKHLCLGNISDNLQPAPSGLESIPENHSENFNGDGGGRQRKLVTAHTIDMGNLKKLQKSSNVVIEDDEDGGLVMGARMSRSATESESGADAQHTKLTRSGIIEENEDEETLNITIIGAAKSRNAVPVNGAAVGGEEVEKKKSIGLFISCDNKRIIVGGGNGEGLWIDGELSKGRSTRCDTFNNKPLTNNQDGDFTITRVDVFSFQ